MANQDYRLEMIGCYDRAFVFACLAVGQKIAALVADNVADELVSMTDDIRSFMSLKIWSFTVAAPGSSPSHQVGSTTRF